MEFLSRSLYPQGLDQSLVIKVNSLPLAKITLTKDKTLNYNNHMKFINLTPHIINEVVSGRSFPPSGTVARVSSQSVLVKTIDDIPIYKTTFGETTGIPEEDMDTFYIVSGMVLDANTNRMDLLAPGELVRDGAGNPIGCKGFRF